MPQVCFTIKDQLLERIEKMASKTERSRSEMIKALLEFAVPTWESGRVNEAVRAGPTTEEVQKMVREIVDTEFKKGLFDHLWNEAVRRVKEGQTKGEQ
jgi:metal-responsive CopG/Arc/MetJ family transcriptional regulator